MLPLPCHATPCRAPPCPALPRLASPCHAMPSHVWYCVLSKGFEPLLTPYQSVVRTFTLREGVLPCHALPCPASCCVGLVGIEPTSPAFQAGAKSFSAIAPNIPCLAGIRFVRSPILARQQTGMRLQVAATPKPILPWWGYRHQTISKVQPLPCQAQPRQTSPRPTMPSHATPC